MEYGGIRWDMKWKRIRIHTFAARQTVHALGVQTPDAGIKRLE